MNLFLDSSAKDRPVKMLHLNRAFGLLSAIEPVEDEDCIIITVGERRRRWVLPVEMEAKLRPLMNQKIAMSRFDDEFCLMSLEEFIALGVRE